MLTPDRSPLRHVSTGTSMVTKGIGWPLQCRCSLRRLSQIPGRTPGHAPAAAVGNCLAGFLTREGRGGADGSGRDHVADRRDRAY